MKSLASIGDNQFFGSSGRQRTFKIFTVLIFVMFALRLAQLQIIEGQEYRSESEAQALKRMRTEPFRGNLYDRKGRLFVHNEPSFSVTITPNEFKRESLKLLADILETDTTDILEKIGKFDHLSRFIPIKIFRDADKQTVSLLEEYNDYLPGVDIIVESKRLYQFEGKMAHILGYTREISKKEIERKKYYNPGDVIGKTGIEYTYETFLRGIEGVEYIAVNKLGERIASFDKGKSDIPSKNGFDLNLAVDLDLQEFAEKLLDGKRGSIVILEPNTGEIMAMVSKPDFDPRDFSGRISAELYNGLLKDKDKPMLNRPIMSANPPGSTWKMLILAAALQEGIVTPSTKIYCGGGMQFGGRFFKCHGAHGNTDARGAIEGSCNTYFYELGLKLGFEKIIEYGEIFGFGSKTQIDLPYEEDGNYITMDYLNKRYNGNPPRGLLLNYGIGQGEILATPLQMAVYVSALANGGVLCQPHVVRSILNHTSRRKEPVSYQSVRLPIEPQHLEVIKKGMSDVVNGGGGTAKTAQIPGVEVCGKTGTAQNPHGKDHAWFICFAPRENPEIAMVVFVENSGFGGAVAAPIAKRLLWKHFFPDKPEPWLKPATSDSTAIDTLNIDITVN